MVILGPLRPLAPADFPRVVSRLTNGHRNCQVSTQKALSFAKNGNRSGKAALLILEGKRKLPPQIIYKPILILKSPCAINYCAINLVKSKWLSCLNSFSQKNSPRVVTIRHCANKLYNLHSLFKPLTGRQILPFNTVPPLPDNESCCSGENKAKREKLTWSC